MKAPTEQLATCELCGQGNLINLKAHQKSKHCRDARKKPGTKALTLAGLDSMPLVLAKGESEDMIIGRALTGQFERCVNNRRDDLLLGAMGVRLREYISSARGRVHPGGAASKDTGVEGWLKLHAPKVSKSILYNCIKMAEGVQELCKLGKKVDLEALLATSVEDLPEKLAKKRAEIEKLIEGKSQRQLLLEFGGAEGKARGGHREKQTKLSPEEEQAAMEATIREDALHAFQAVEELGPRYRILTDAEAERGAEILEEVAAAIHAWLKTPKNKRPVLDAVKALLGDQH